MCVQGSSRPQNMCAHLDEGACVCILSVIHKNVYKCLQVYMQMDVGRECTDTCMCQGCELEGERRTRAGWQKTEQVGDGVQTLG